VKVGVLGLQGDVREHVRALEAAGTTAVVVRTPGELAGVDALVMPGGESTTIGKLLRRFELHEPLRARAGSGMPLFGTCAGLILMATEIEGREDAPDRLGLMDVAVRRNAYGRQIASFEAEVPVQGLDEPVAAAFIRAPVVERVGDGVAVLASWDDRPVVVRQGSMLGATFHPEIAGDAGLHRLFVSMAEGNEVRG
jgi:5'-phosphate synthase pdxT subunit